MTQLENYEIVFALEQHFSQIQSNSVANLLYLVSAPDLWSKRFILDPKRTSLQQNVLLSILQTDREALTSKKLFKACYDLCPLPSISEHRTHTHHQLRSAWPWAQSVRAWPQNPQSPGLEPRSWWTHRDRWSRPARLPLAHPARLLRYLHQWRQQMCKEILTRFIQREANQF